MTRVNLSRKIDYWVYIVLGQKNEKFVTVLMVLSLFLLTLFSPQSVLSSEAPNTTGTVNSNIISRSDAEVDYLNEINNLRKSMGQKKLIVDRRLSISARKKALDMLYIGYWGHYAPNNVSFADYIWGDSPKATKVGENLAKCYKDRSGTFKALKASPTHYAIMIGDFTDFGVAEVKDTNNGCINTVMHFSKYK